MKVSIFAVFAFLFCLPQLGCSQTTPTPISPKVLSLPLSAPGQTVAPLRSLEDSAMSLHLQQQLFKRPSWKKLIAQKRMAVALVELSDPSNIKFAHLNGHEMMYAASLPKIAILLAAMDAFEKGELEETEEILADIRLMISKSNNQASTRMIDRLGYEKIESVLTDPKYELFDEEYGGGLWVGKRYASAGERHPDPLKGLSHAATAEQVARFYYLLAQGKLVSYERSQQMLDIMQDPALHHKFVNTLDRVAPKAKLFRKSGSWKTFHSDSILVWGSGWRHYILVALVNDAQGEQIMRDLVREVETVLHPVK